MPPPSIESVLAAPASPSDRTLKRQPRPNFSVIHRCPLPLQTQPLPPLFPHNPLSYIHVALAYLIQTFSPIQSHPKPLYRAYISSLTQSVHVTDEETIRALWEMGFFGKGSLSRSETEWARKQKTSTEATRKRREERRKFKLERAKQEREAIKQKLKEEEEAHLATRQDDDTGEHNISTKQNGHANGYVPRPRTPTHGISVSTSGPEERESEDGSSPLRETLPNGNGHISHQSEPSTSGSENGHVIGTRDDVSIRSASSSKTVRFSPTVERLEFEIPSPIDITLLPRASKDHAADSLMENQEHLQLTYEEAFFLSYGLGVLQVYSEDLTTPILPSSLLRQFQRSHVLSRPPEPDDPFLVSYAVYHHFRSLGWIVRSGSKFSVDYLLYNRGPVFSHAEFAVIILPSYSHEYWAVTEGGKQKTAKNETKSWWWLHCVNRVQSSVQKNLVLCYVEIPPPDKTKGEGGAVEEGKDVDIAEFFKRYKVREINIKRWSPNRMRD